MRTRLEQTEEEARTEVEVEVQLLYLIVYFVGQVVSRPATVQRHRGHY